MFVANSPAIRKIERDGHSSVRRENFWMKLWLLLAKIALRSM
jgi:hypothetical protein